MDQSVMNEEICINWKEKNTDKMSLRSQNGFKKQHIFVNGNFNGYNR